MNIIITGQYLDFIHTMKMDYSDELIQNSGRDAKGEQPREKRKAGQKRGN